jgi:hypothetical protein
MKTTLGEVCGVLLIAALAVWGIVSIEASDRARQKMKNDCLYSPSWETCRPCADLPQRDMDVCRSVLASIVAKGAK